MKYRRNTIQSPRGLTLLEMVIALAIMAISMAALLPQFRLISNSWDTKQGTSEALQNARVMIDHLNRNLTKAVKVTSVSDSAETDGFIEFEDNDGNTLRYDIAANNYIEFGLVGDLSDLAGTVSSLQFTCYDACDLDTPLDIATADVNTIRFVKAETIMTNSAALGQDKTFSTSIYIHTNSDGSGTANFGNENVEQNGLNNIKNIQVATQVTIDEDATVTSISAYVKGSTVKLLRYAIYTDNAGEPDSLIVESASEAIGSNAYHWHQTNITPSELTAGTYWLALSFAHNTMYVVQSDAGSGQVRYNTNDAVNDGFSSSWGTSSESNTRRFSMYATYLTDSAANP